MIIFVALLLLLAVSFPYIRRAAERVVFLKRVGNLCALKKYELKVYAPILSLFCNFSKKYDVTVDTGKTLYAVKFWDEQYRHSNLVFCSDRRVILRRKIQDTFGKENKRTHKIYERSLGVLAELRTPSSEGRKKVCIIAISPEEAKVFYSDGGQITRVSSGDRLYGMTISTRREIIQILKN